MDPRQRFAGVAENIAAQNSSRVLNESLRAMIIDYVNNGGDPDSSPNSRAIDVMNAAIQHRNIAAMQHILGYPELSLGDKKNAIATCKASAFEDDDNSKALNTIQRMIAVDIAEMASSAAHNESRKANAADNASNAPASDGVLNPADRKQEDDRFIFKSKIDTARNFILSDDIQSRRGGVNMLCVLLSKPEYQRFIQENKHDVEELKNLSKPIMDDFKAKLSESVNNMIASGNYVDARKNLQGKLQDYQKALTLFPEIKASLEELGKTITLDMTSKFIANEMKENGRSNPQVALENIAKFQREHQEEIFNSSTARQMLTSTRTQLSRASVTIPTSNSTPNTQSAQVKDSVPSSRSAPPSVTVSGNDNNAAPEPNAKHVEARKREADQYKRMSASGVFGRPQSAAPPIKKADSFKSSSDKANDNQDKQADNKSSFGFGKGM